MRSVWANMADAFVVLTGTIGNSFQGALDNSVTFSVSHTTDIQTSDFTQSSEQPHRPYVTQCKCPAKFPGERQLI